MSGERHIPSTNYTYSGQNNTKFSSFSSQNQYNSYGTGRSNVGMGKNSPSFQPSYQFDQHERNRNRPMYSSTIQFSDSKSDAKTGFSLQSMGRVVNQSSKYETKQTPPTIQTHFNSGYEEKKIFEKYSQNKSHEPKMGFPSSYLSPQNSTNFDRFPSFNLNSSSNKEVAKENTQVPRVEGLHHDQTTEEKRKRQIMEIKKQLEAINKKMTVTNNAGNKNSGEHSGHPKEKPHGISQSFIFPSSTSTDFSEPSKPISEHSEKLSSLDKLFEQKKKPKVSQETEIIPKQNFSGQNYTSFNQHTTNTYQPMPHTQKTQKFSFQSKTEPRHEQTYNFKQHDFTQKVEQKSFIPKSIAEKEPLVEAVEVAQQSQPSSFKKKKKMMMGETFSPKNMSNERQPMFKKMVSLEMEVPQPQKLVKFKREDFQIGKKMGKGQFGEVQLVKHKATGFLCALKVMEKKQIRDENYVGQIARELSIQFYLNHRYVAPLYGYFSDENNVYLLQQFCEGGQLLEKLRKQRRMNERDVSLIIKQVCEGIDYIHKELIIHRDIKPENILFTHGAVKISDFGWAVYRGMGMRKTASGSPLYYPPEIVKGEEYDDKIDVWNIGMMTYQCLLGKIPFRIYTEMDLDRIVSDDITFPEYVEVSDDAKDFILGTMKKQGDERMEIRQMLRHPFITKQEQTRLPASVMEEFKRVLNG